VLQDAAIHVERWLLRKVSDGMRATINKAILIGGVSTMPSDGWIRRACRYLRCLAGHPSPVTFSWQDLVVLKFEQPTQWHTGPFI
jgi:hypothetical protein